MSTIQSQVLEEFYRRLGQADGFTETIVRQIRGQFDGGRKLKAADLVKVLSGPAKENLP
jgi:hypothetical protein